MLLLLVIHQDFIVGDEMSYNRKIVLNLVYIDDLSMELQNVSFCVMLNVIIREKPHSLMPHPLYR